MNKTASMLVEETKKKFTQACNEAQLPPCIIELIIKDLLHEIHDLAERQLEMEKTVYTKTLQQEMDMQSTQEEFETENEGNNDNN